MAPIETKLIPPSPPVTQKQQRPQPRECATFTRSLKIELKGWLVPSYIGDENGQVKQDIVTLKNDAINSNNNQVKKFVLKLESNYDNE